MDSYLPERRLDGAIYLEAMGERKGGGVTCYTQTRQLSNRREALVLLNPWEHDPFYIPRVSPL